MLAAVVAATICGLAAGGGHGLLCPQSRAHEVIKLPQVSPCKVPFLRKGNVTTKAHNTEAYVTEAWMVTADVCFGNSSTGFFNSHTCTRGCKPYPLTPGMALDLKNGFCPTLGSRAHSKFNREMGGVPSCQYAWMSSVTLSVLRCRRHAGHAVFVHGGSVHSTLAPVITCNYTDGGCQLGEGSWIFWDVDERSSSEWRFTEHNEARCDGTRILLPERGAGFGLKNVSGCEWEGYAETYEGVFLKWEAKRSKREVPKSTLALGEFLAGEVGVEAGTFCDTMLGKVPASTLIHHAHASSYARLLLESPALIARALDHHLLVWRCQMVLVRPRGGKCHSRPRVEYFTGSQWLPAFLADDGQVVKKAGPRDCHTHLLHYHLNGTVLVEEGERTSELAVTVASYKHVSTLKALDPNFTNLFFDKDVLDVEIHDLAEMQHKLVSFARDLGGSIGGTGGGHGNTNLPGLVFGGLASSVAFFQTLGSLCGIAALIWMVASRCMRSRTIYIPVRGPGGL
ncbi:putative glycoprotein [Beihai rhabdo-like virus 6]|uniref:Putative glycoprotein n=1 Tax=Beihai rhabdo-like virus 6 TaxID=1922656 RepID=A0A1L3KMN0_9MONO|nr:putative glycoprotein [Beihai rhabdo-like virus 6]APG78638.1 putative glycoprotein [Beihai rhabdo-like virus 6]